jgi:hypothetical protein
MLATSSFAGKILGSYQYLFLVVYEDYTDFGRAFVRNSTPYTSKGSRGTSRVAVQ